LCFDKNQVKLLNNWKDQQFNNIFIAIDRCNPRIRTCKSKTEIDQFFNENMFYFGSQQTEVESTIFFGDEDPIFSEKENPDNYYPLKKL